MSERGIKEYKKVRKEEIERERERERPRGKGKGLGLRSPLHFFQSAKS